MMLPKRCPHAHWPYYRCADCTREAVRLSGMQLAGRHALEFPCDVCGARSGEKCRAFAWGVTPDWVPEIHRPRLERVQFAAIGAAARVF